MTEPSAISPKPSLLGRRLTTALLYAAAVGLAASGYFIEYGVAGSGSPWRPPAPRISDGAPETRPAESGLAGAASRRDVVMVDWGRLGEFEWNPGTPLPHTVLELHETPVSVSGFMIVLDRDTEMKEFALVGALWSCCYGVPPRMNQVVVVEVPASLHLGFIPGPISVLGTLEVGEHRGGDGSVESVYRLRATGVARRP